VWPAGVGGVWPAAADASMSPLAAYYDQEDNWQNIDLFNKVKIPHQYCTTDAGTCV
jgi:hypothetical protein